MDGGRPAAARPAHRSRLVLHLQGRPPARGRRSLAQRSACRATTSATASSPATCRWSAKRSTRSSRPGASCEIVVDERERRRGAGDRTTTAARRLADADDRRRRSLGMRAATATALLDEAGLNPRYTFETFVKGASNQFALAAALRVAETPARSYNPLFIYGSAGLGKTHLLHAIGHYVHHNYQHHDVRYVSTETFLNEFVDAIRDQHRQRLQAPLPRHRRPAHRRHPVPREPRGPPGGVLPHVQLAARREQADRDLVATACPTPSRRSRSACAAGSSGA